MPSVTLLAADPHLTSVRARPALVFGRRGTRADGRAARRSARSRRLRTGRAKAFWPEPSGLRTSTDAPVAGRVASVFRKAPGLLWLVCGGVLLFGIPLLHRVRRARRHDAETIADLRDTVAALSAELARLKVEDERSPAAASKTISQFAAPSLPDEPAVGRSAAEPPTTGGTPPPDGIAANLAPETTTHGPRDAGMNRADDHGAVPAAGSGQRDAAIVHDGTVADASSAEAPAANIVVRLPACRVTADQRWDALPTDGWATASGWAAPPTAPATAIRSGRFRRETRLVAASLVRTPHRVEPAYPATAAHRDGEPPRTRRAWIGRWRARRSGRSELEPERISRVPAAPDGIGLAQAE